jgi:hypothetical protein
MKKLWKNPDSFFLPFLLLAATGLRSRAGRVLVATTLAYVALRFLVLPNWQERWVAVFYPSAMVCAALAQTASEADLRSEFEQHRLTALSVSKRCSTSTSL